MKPPSQRFIASKKARIIVPIVLTLLSLGLIAILVAIVLAVLGVFPTA
jgi:hypothetical protein